MKINQYRCRCRRKKTLYSYLLIKVVKNEMNKYLLPILYLVFFIAISADELNEKVKLKNLRQIKYFLDILGTDQSKILYDTR